MSAPQANDAEKNIEIWKVKKLIKRLEAARGNGTSMISLIIPPKDQVSRAAKMLAEEFGTASNIKSRVNRLSVLSAITSTQQRLKLYSKVPPNGLVVYCGEIITSEGKERRINIDFEPFKPINTSLYLCDNKFHTEALSELLESDQKFGFIIMDGNGALFGTLSGNTRDVVHKFSVDLPKKHGRGGQSALRFARLREEKRHNYVRKVAELAVQNFISNDKVNVVGLILAGSADFKNDLNQSDMFDQRLVAKVIKIVDVSYGGENGFNQAIELSSETLSNVKFIQEKKLINKYFDEISQDSGKVCYGIDDTLKALEAGAAETLIVFENLEMTRWELKNSEGGQIILHTNKAQELDRSLFMDKETGQEMDVVDQQPFLEWLAEKYRDFGATLEFVSDRSSEGNQFVRGFGGIGAIMRYKLNFEQLADLSDEDEFYDAHHATPSGMPMSRQQHGNEEHAATATASAAIEADTNGVANTLATTHLAGTIVKTMAINAGSLKAAVNINKPKVTSPLRTCATPGGSVTHAPAEMDKISSLVGTIRT
ncbi:translation termination factor eRF1 [Extremus antarcticus]|uniref:Translation termination factor eRF1 n=1 Tax=Extremus antarcticus TaxID=702011 RepID=A0AAJ0DC01_9PEZI|nr:translation termination factor eRF1 [Extremus antarcticus]